MLSSSPSFLELADRIVLDFVRRASRPEPDFSNEVGMSFRIASLKFFPPVQPVWNSPLFHSATPRVSVAPG